MLTLGCLAAALGLDYKGDPDRELHALAPVDKAGPENLSFVVAPEFLAALQATAAGAVIVPEALADHAPCDILVADDPHASMARASWLLEPERRPDPGIDPDARVGGSSCIAPTAAIGPGVVIGDNCTIGDRVIIGAHAVIGNDVSIGSDSRLFPHVTLYDRVVIGARCRIQSGAVIGGEGFGYASTDNGWLAIHHTGGVLIGERVHVGANTTIDCGTLTPTRIGDGVILDNQIQIAHNVDIGRHTAIAGCTGIAGSTRIGERCRIGGACNIVGHIRIADDVVLNAASLVTRSIDEAGRYGSGTALLPVRSWRRNYVASGHMAEVMTRLARLERLLDNNNDTQEP